MGQKVPRQPMRGSKWGRGRTKEGKKVMNGLLAHPFPCENGLLSTLSRKGWTNRPFSEGSSSQCEALRAFSTRFHASSHHCAENTLYIKKTLFEENSQKQEITKIANISEIFLTYFLCQMKKKQTYFFCPLSTLAAAWRLPPARISPLLKMKNGWEKIKNQVRRHPKGGPENSFFFEK